MPGVRTDPELLEEIDGLLASGFVAGWIRDLKVGDIFAGPRLFAFDEPRKMYAVERILRQEADYFNEEDDSITHNVVVNMIVRDVEDRQLHLAYGHTHEIYIWRV